MEESARGSKWETRRKTKASLFIFSYITLILCCIKHFIFLFSKSFPEKLITMEQMASDPGQDLPETSRNFKGEFTQNKDCFLKTFLGDKWSKLCQEEMMHFLSSVHISTVPAY